MPNAKTNYVVATDITITLAGLGHDANLLAGRESNELTNSANGYRDAWVAGKITTGTSGSAGPVEVWAIGWNGSGWPDVFDGTDSPETISSAVIKLGICRLVHQATMPAGSNLVTEFGPRLLSDVFGGDVPEKVVFFVTHNTNTPLNATAANHYIRIQQVYDSI
ncbi:MAG: hypothetical protein ACK5XN_09565 [Bacteroidota bacterium]|jgi:hypothetical protein